MDITREGKAKIGIKDVVRAWKNRVKDTRTVMTDARCPGFMLITNANSQTWTTEYRPRGVNAVTGKRFPMRSITIGTPATHSPDEALAEALRIKGATKAGKDPAADRKAAIAEAALERASTVERAVADYIASPANKGEEGRRTYLASMGGRASRSPQPRRRHARNSVIPNHERRRQDSAQASTRRELQAPFRRSQSIPGLGRARRPDHGQPLRFDRPRLPAGRGRRARTHALAQGPGADLGGDREGARARRSATSFGSQSQRRRAATRSPIYVGSIWISTPRSGASQES